MFFYKTVVALYESDNDNKDDDKDGIELLLLVPSAIWPYAIHDTKCNYNSNYATITSKKRIHRLLLSNTIREEQ